MSRPQILFLETVDPAAMQLLPDDQYQISELTNSYPDVRAVMTRGKGQVDRSLIDRCPKLEVVVRCGVGVNNIDVDYATERGVRVLNVPGVNAATVAEHTLGLMLLLVRGMYRLISEVKAGNWAYRDEYAGRELRGLQLGIIGRGDIGQRLGGAAGESGMTVRYAQHRRNGATDELPLRELLSTSDVISLHLPLTSATRELMGTNSLGQMKVGSFLINTARGELVNAPALLQALERGRLAGYASDLAIGEGEVAERLLARPDVLITPHAASLTGLTYREMSERAVQHLVDHFAGRPIPAAYRVNGVGADGGA